MSNQSYHYSDLPKKIGLVRPVQQKIKLPSPYLFHSLVGFHFYKVKCSNDY